MKDDKFCQLPMMTEAQILALEAQKQLLGIQSTYPTWADFISLQTSVAEMVEMVGGIILPPVPLLISTFTNDMGFITAGAIPTNVSAFTNDASYVTASSLATSLSSYVLTSDFTTALALKFNVPVGSTSQYLRGDGTLAAFPSIPTVPTEVSSFTNDANYVNASGLTSALTSYALTAVLSSYVTTSSLTTTLALFSNTTAMNAAIAAAVAAIAIPSVARATSTDTISLVGTGATGAQVHATKDSTVRYNVSTSTTSTIGGPATSLVALKICATNDATEANWTTVATFESDQTITLAIILNSVQTVKGQLSADVPAGWYRKLVNSGSGTHAEAFVSGQKTIYG